MGVRLISRQEKHVRFAPILRFINGDFREFSTGFRQLQALESALELL